MMCRDGSELEGISAIPFGEEMIRGKSGTDCRRYTLDHFRQSLNVGDLAIFDSSRLRRLRIVDISLVVSFPG